MAYTIAHLLVHLRYPARAYPCESILYRTTTPILALMRCNAYEDHPDMLEISVARSVNLFSPSFPARSNTSALACCSWPTCKLPEADFDDNCEPRISIGFATVGRSYEVAQRDRRSVDRLAVGTFVLENLAEGQLNLPRYQPSWHTKMIIASKEST